jgi:CheY-like chemotaxis protein
MARDRRRANRSRWTGLHVVASSTRGVQAPVEQSSRTPPHLLGGAGSWRPGGRAGEVRSLRLPSRGPDSRGVRGLIVVRHRLFAEALRTILEEDGMQILALPSGAKEAIEAIGRDHPDLVLVDLDLPGSQALELRRRILGKGCKLVGLIAVSHPSRGYQTVPSGLDGYVSKDISPSDFIEAIRTVLREKDPGARVPGGPRRDGPEPPMDVGNDSSPAL